MKTTAGALRAGPVHHDFERNRNLLFDLFCRNSRPLSNDIDVVVCDVRVCFDREQMEREAPQTNSSSAAAKTRSGFPAQNLLIYESLLFYRALEGQGIRYASIPGFDS